MNHILDYAKISSAARQQRKNRITEEATRHTTASVVDDGSSHAGVHIDLAQLTEEVVETTVAAHRYQHFTKSDLHSYRHGDSSFDEHSLTKPEVGSGPSNYPVSVVVNIAWRDSWIVKMSACLHLTLSFMGVHY